MHSQQTPDKEHTPRGRGILRALRGGPGIFIGLILIIWVVLPLPILDDLGLLFGWVYRIFFTAMVLLGALFFWFLGKEHIQQPKSAVGVLGSLAGVFLLTVGFLVAAGVVYPQFERPEPPGEAAEDPVERGAELFVSTTPPCISCHIISGRGQTRGPDLTDVASRADQRVPDLSAEQYLREKIMAGLSYKFTVPEYAPIMPPFGQLLSEAQIEDLVAYLLAPK